MHFDILRPVSGPDFTFLTTLVRASGRGISSDADRLERQVREVALEGQDITIFVREVEELGADGIAALRRVAALVDRWPPGARLFILALHGSAVLEELQASDLARHARVWLEDIGPD